MSEIVERAIDGLGTLTFENLEAGEWVTRRGEPAKRPRRRYLLDVDGERCELDSVSAIVGCLEKPALYYWHETQGALGVLETQRQMDTADLPDDEIVRKMRSLDLGARAAKEQAADRGLVTHSVLQTLATTGEPPSLGDYAVEVRPWITGAARLWLALNPEPAESECIVCHPSLGYAGRFDFICRTGGQRTLLDYKTGKGNVYPEAHWQARAYADCLEFSGIEPVDDVVIVGIGDDGSFQLVKCAATSEDFAALAHTYRAAKRIKAAMASERKMAKATP